MKLRPYGKAEDALVHTDERADKCWIDIHNSKDATIVDVFLGILLLEVACTNFPAVSSSCEECRCLYLTLPSKPMRTLNVTVFSTDGSARPSVHTFTVPKFGNCMDLIQAISISCSLRSDENLLVAEIYHNHITRYLEETSDPLTLVKDNDRLGAYRLPKDAEESPLVVFMHQLIEEHDINSEMASGWKALGCPFIAKLRNIVVGSDIQNLFLTLLKPFVKLRKASLDDQNHIRKSPGSEGTQMVDSISCTVSVDGNPTNESGNDSHFEMEWQFYLTDEKGKSKGSKIELSKPIPVTDLHKPLHVMVCFAYQAIEQYEMSLLNSLPENFKPENTSDELPKPISLYACLDATLKGVPMDMRDCTSCNVKVQAIKKSSFLVLPEILMIHLNRSSQSMGMVNKLETFVDFHIDDLDLLTYCSPKVSRRWSTHYMLYAVINHHGDMKSGHYTAYILVSGLAIIYYLAYYYPQLHFFSIEIENSLTAIEFSQSTYLICESNVEIFSSMTNKNQIISSSNKSSK